MIGADVSESTPRDGDEIDPARVNAESRDIVYTALFGQYESLNEEPFAVDSAAAFICFTDDPSLTSETWQIELVEPRFPMDPIRSARWVKIYGHELVCRNVDRSLWVDNRVRLRCEPRKILDSVLEEPTCDIAMFEHSFRERVIDEFDAVTQGGYDDPGRVYEQLLHYAESSPDVLDQRPLWTGFMARRHNDQVASAMQTWAAHVCRYSRRDQLSVNFALKEPKLLVRRLEGENRESDWHEWPPISAELNRRRETRSRAFEHSVRAPLARLRVLERDQNDLLEAHVVSAAKKDKVIAKQRARADELEALYRVETKRRRQAEISLGKSRERTERLAQRVLRLRRRLESAEAQEDPRPDRYLVALKDHARNVKAAGSRAASKVRARVHG